MLRNEKKSHAVAQSLRSLAAGLLAAGAMLIIGRSADAQVIAQTHRQDDEHARRAERQPAERIEPVDFSELGEGWGDPPLGPRPE